MEHLGAITCITAHDSESDSKKLPYNLFDRQEELPFDCHAKSVAWTNRVISPGIYKVSNGFTVIWLSGLFRGSLLYHTDFLCTLLGPSSNLLWRRRRRRQTHLYSPHYFLGLCPIYKEREKRCGSVNTPRMTKGWSTYLRSISAWLHQKLEGNLHIWPTIQDRKTLPNNLSRESCLKN